MMVDRLKNRLMYETDIDIRYQLCRRKETAPYQYP